MKRFLPYCHRSPSAWMLVLCFGLLLTANTASADGNDLVIPLNEAALTHVELTLDHYAERVKTDPGLRKDFKSFQGDNRLSGDTEQAVSAAISRRHPKFAAFATQEKWTPGGLYLTYIMCVGIPVSEATGATSKDADNAKVRKNMQFYEKHKARMDVLAMRFDHVFN